MKKIMGFLLVLILITTPSLAKDKKLVFDEMAAWSYIKDLACDCMQGRQSGHPGGVMGEEYIAAKFKKWGLEPAGDNGTYFQEFTVDYRYVNQGASFEVWTDKLHRDFYYGEDWRVQRYSGSGHFVAEVVFVGFGIHAPDKGYDDYADVDVKGKIVLFTTGAPAKLADKLTEEAKMDKRIKTAKKLGAKGVIGFQHPSSESRYFRLRLSQELYDPHFVILSAKSRITDFIFKELKTDLRYPFQEIDEKGKPMSFATGVKVYISVDAEFDPERKTRNILAKITGSDKQKKDEYVIIGGHMDHLGVSPYGDVYNGANDNASGTAVMMEIARIMKLNKAKPKRTVIFAAWAGEELGLLGSRHYCDHPTHSIEKTITYFNMDMVAHGNGIVPFSGVYYGPWIWDAVKEKLSQEMLEYIKPGRGGPGGSDHSPFLAKGVPAYGVMTRGHHFKYHHVRDDADLVKPELLKKVGDFVHTATKIIADETGDFIKPQRQAVYNLKYQNLINFKLNKLAGVVEHKKDVKDSHVDLQLSIIGEKKGLSGDELRIDIINNLFTAVEKLKAAKGLEGFSLSRGIRQAVRAGKTTILAGLKGLNSFKDDPKWAEVLAKQGAYFVIVDNPTALFEGDELSDKGNQIIKGINQSGLLLMVKGTTAIQAKLLLNVSKKPFVLLEENLPEQEVLDLVKEKEAAVGLVLAKGADAEGYFKALNEAKEAVGSEHVMIVNEDCVWKDAGKGQMIALISQIIGAEYDRGDFQNVISGTFMRVLNAARADNTSQASPRRPF